MEAYLSVAIVFAIWALCVFIESKRGSHIKPPEVSSQAPDVNYGIVETTDTLGASVDNPEFLPKEPTGVVNKNTSAKKRKRQRKQAHKRTLEQG